MSGVGLKASTQTQQGLQGIHVKDERGVLRGLGSAVWGCGCLSLAKRNLDLVAWAHQAFSMGTHM